MEKEKPASYILNKKLSTCFFVSWKYAKCANNFLSRPPGDLVLDGSSTLTLTASSLQQLTRMFEQYLLPRSKQRGFLALPSHPADTASLLQLQFLFDVLQKTVSLKVSKDPGAWHGDATVQLFRMVTRCVVGGEDVLLCFTHPKEHHSQSVEFRSIQDSRNNQPLVLRLKMFWLATLHRIFSVS